ncbi:MAG: UDP-N-acetylmuramoyl-L-alanine--D-glutamate ligase [Kiritimatiellae bacterium]|nr:UDP-N-acetylmuramoyl-L-alanine--D-glutamate ligase [Kiritimatiellia bacterium]
MTPAFLPEVSGWVVMLRFALRGKELKKRRSSSKKVLNVKKYTTALVLGLGISGEAAARLMLAEGARVTVIDSRNSADVVERAMNLRKAGADVVTECKDVPGGNFDVCIISPGLSLDSGWAMEVKKRRIDLISELELGASRCVSEVLAITGTNGKSTMAKLCEEALICSDSCTEIAGNYGPALCDVVRRKQELDWIVVEVSSFQLEAVSAFRPRVGVVLNIQPDHLDRHGDMDVYTGLKSRIFGAMDESDVGIVFENDMEKVSAATTGKNRWVSFGLSTEADYRYRDGCVYWQEISGNRSSDQANTHISFAGTVFDNEVMGLTAAAAVAAVHECGKSACAVRDAAQRFESLPHRMCELGNVCGARFVDDSKATNLAALGAALKMVGGGVRLIAGGIIKERGLHGVRELLARTTRKIYLIGESADKMEAAWGDVIECEKCGYLENAVASAWNDAIQSEVILLSPGCASFDQFKDFNDRGNQFEALVKNLVQEKVVK